MPYRSNPGRPGRRLIPTRSLIDGAAIMTMAPKAPKTPAQYGRDCERDAAKLLSKQGYSVTRSHLSRGAADLVAVHPAGWTRLIQIKSCQVFKPLALNRGLGEILTAPPVQQRECWLYLHGRGLVAIVTIAPDGSWNIGGREPYVSELRPAIAKALIRIQRTKH